MFGSYQKYEVSAAAADAAAARRIAVAHLMVSETERVPDGDMESFRQQSPAHLEATGDAPQERRIQASMTGWTQ